MMYVEVARRMVEAWHKNTGIWRAVKIGLLEAGEIPTTQLVREQLGTAAYVYKAKAYFYDFYSIVSEMLWTCKSDEKCVEMMMKLKPDPHMRHKILPKDQKRPHIVIRWRDQVGQTSSNWKHVK